VGVKAINYSYNLNYKKYAELEKVETDVGQIYNNNNNSWVQVFQNKKFKELPEFGSFIF